jgi:hypothetical protein
LAAGFPPATSATEMARRAACRNPGFSPSMAPGRHREGAVARVSDLGLVGLLQADGKPSVSPSFAGWTSSAAEASKPGEDHHLCLPGLDSRDRVAAPDRNESSCDPSARRVIWRIGHCEETRVVLGGTTWIHITHAADSRDAVRDAPW